MTDPHGIAALFLKYDYQEAKEWAKSFLSLVSAILVFSISFSDKIVGLQTASSRSKSALATAWVSHISSIILCGLAICFLSYAAGEAVYGGDFQHNANAAYLLLLLSGFSFVVGLLSLVVAGLDSLRRRP